MNRLIVLFMLVAIVLPLHALDKTKYKMVPRYNRLTNTVTSYPLVTIRDIQYVPDASLAVADAHQVSSDVSSPYWTSQVSTHMGDTVVVIATAITQAAPYDPWFGITFTAHGWTMLLHDTAANSNRWGGILVRAGCPTSTCGDTAQARLDGFLNVERGDIILIGATTENPSFEVIAGADLA